MSKTIYLIRHATAEEGSHSAMLKDIDRELISKGIMESAKLGSYLKSNIPPLDLLITSPAERTKATAKVIAEQLKIETDGILVNDNLYGGGPRAYLSALNSLDEGASNVAIVGHNPDISFFAEYLTRDDIGGSMQKATVIGLEIDETRWSEISSKMMNLKLRIDVSEINEK